jgi:hypothetical protein
MRRRNEDALFELLKAIFQGKFPEYKDKNIDLI